MIYVLGMDSYIKMLVAGFEAPLPRIVSATLRALASALFNFSEDMGLQLLQSLLEKVSEYIVSPNREIVAAALSFLKVFFIKLF